MSSPIPNQISVPSATTPYHTAEDNSQLLTISPSTIFLHDGVLRSIQLKSLKEFELHAKYHDALTTSSAAEMEELMAIGLTNASVNGDRSKSPVTEDLSRKILRLSTLHVQSIGLHHRYQWHVLERVWRYKQARALEKLEKDSSSVTASTSENDNEVQDGMASSARLGFKLSLCLLVPMLEMYSNQNQSVALSALQLIFSELSTVPVMSLSLNQDSSNSIGKLEDLLQQWASNPNPEFQVPGPSALISLACARGTISSFAKTILMLENLESPLRLLPVAPILRKLNDSRSRGPGKPCAIQAEKHIYTWPYDDHLMLDSIQMEKTLGTKSHPLLTLPHQPERNDQVQIDTQQQIRNRSGPPPPPPLPSTRPGTPGAPTAAPSEDIQRHHVTTDGSFLYVTGPDGKGISKMGSGVNGTVQGWVYHNNIELNCGLLTYSDDILVSRPYELDKPFALPFSQEMSDTVCLGVAVDSITLQPQKLILVEGKANAFQKKNFVTLGLTSDGSLIYLVRAELPSSPQKEMVASESSFLVPPSPPIIQIWLEIFSLSQSRGGNIKAIPKSAPIPLTRQEELPNMTQITPVVVTNTVPEERAGPTSIRRTRSVRITPTTAPPPPPPHPVSTACFDNTNTSLNATLKQLQHGLYFSCGNFLTIIFSTNISLFLGSTPLPGPGPTAPLMTTYRQYCPVMSSTSSKSLGFQLHVNLSKVSNGKGFIVKEDFAHLPVNSSFFHGAVIPEMGAVYDSTNNLIWTVTGSLVDSWRNPGHIPPWKQNKMLLLGNTLNPDISIQGKDGQMADVKTVINVMIRHVGIMANHFILGDKENSDIGFVNEGNSSTIRTLTELIVKYKEKFGEPELTSIFLTLQGIVSELKRGRVGEESGLGKELKKVLNLALALLDDFGKDERLRKSVVVCRQACTLFAMAFDLIYVTQQGRNEFFREMYNFLDAEQDIFEAEEGEEDCKVCRRLLEETILRKFAEYLDNPAVSFEEGSKWVLESPWLSKAILSSSSETRETFLKISDGNWKTEDIARIGSMQPTTTVRTEYVSEVVNFLLRCLTLPQNGRNAVDMAIEVFREVLKIGPALVESCMEFVGGAEGQKLAVHNCAEEILRGSLMGNGIPQIMAFISTDLSSARPILDELAEECIQFTVAMSFLVNKMNSVSDQVGIDWSSQVRIPSPWNSKKSFESGHPIRENFKTKDTIVIPNARQLYVKIHPQSATQYDYDRLVFSKDSKKIAEFGGNYYGYGNRFFSGPGWARNLIKLTDGNSVTYSFEMKSGREHAIPDKALYGYSFTIFPVMDYSDEMNKTKGHDETSRFTAVTALHSIDVIQNISRVLLEGYEPTPEERSNAHVLENKFVASLKWSSRQSVGSDIVPRKFSQELIAKLKRTVGVPPLQMRLSIIEKMHVPELEELYVQCCLQHIGPNPFLNLETILSPVCESCWSMEPTREILREIFNLINTLFRKLMACYEMEKMLSQEIEEISNKTKDISEAFFKNPVFLENSNDLQILAWICYLEYEMDNPSNLINDVTAMVDALSADGTPPTLTRTDELIEETHLKCKHLLAATPSSRIFGPVYPTQKVIFEKLHNIHNFVSSHMGNPSSTMASFFEAVRSRRERAGDRIKGLDILHKVLECSSPSSSLLIVASLLLQNGPRLKSILCSGLEPEVIRIFGEVMKTAVGIAEKNPLLHRYSIALLSVTAYDKTDEENLVGSGLVGLLDQLCAFQTGHLTENGEALANQDIHNKASTLAWAAFQVLASQCASWEQQHSGKHQKHFEDNSSEWDEPEHKELPLQISINITNHLARAAALAALSSSGNTLDDRNTCSPSLSVAIQDVLDLLSNLRQYQIGRAILKQSPCISRLLGLLQDHRLSPRLVMTILKLLNTALPLVDDLDNANFKQIVPTRGSIPGHRGSHQQAATMSSYWSVVSSTPYTQVSSMLLSKLADYLVCGSSKTDSSKVNCITEEEPATPQVTSGQGLTDPKFERMEVWLHKINDTQNPTSALIRQLFVEVARQDLRPTRGTMGELESELNSNGKVLLYIDESSVAERKALRISQLGHLVTLLPAGWSRTLYHLNLGVHAGNRTGSGSASSTVCKDRNAHLSAWDPSRPFLSGHVAENLASEIVQLVRTLLTSPSKVGSRGVSGCSSRGNLQSGSSTTSMSSMAGAASICTGVGIDSDSLASEPSTQLSQKSGSAWPTAVEQVVVAAMKLLPRLLSIQNPMMGHIESYVYSSRLIIAALTVLGGFTETIRAGLEVWIVDEESERKVLSHLEDDGDIWEYGATRGKVISVSDTTPTAKVELIQAATKGKSEKKQLAVADVVTVPLSRLVPAHYTKCGAPHLPNLSRLAQIELAGFLKTLLIHSGAGGSSKTVGSASVPPVQQEYPLKKSLPTLTQIVSSANSSGSSGQAPAQTISESRQIAQSMTIIRLLAEIRTKSMQVLALWLKRKEFVDIFMGVGSESQFSTKKFSSEVQQCSENLKELSKLCTPSYKTNSVECHVAWMRLLYRDCTRPARLPITDKLYPGGTPGQDETMRWDLSKQFPKIKSAVFSSLSNSLVYTGDYNVSGGNPRGLVLFGNKPVPWSGFYWEATIVTMEDLGQHADLIVVPPLSIGLSPVAGSFTTSPSNDVWKYPSGTVMYTALGRVVHFKAQDAQSWITLRLEDDFRVRAGDTIGVGWEVEEPPTQSPGFGRMVRQGGQQNMSNPDRVTYSNRAGRRRHTVRNLNQVTDLGMPGRIYFTLNGRRLPTTVEQANLSMHAILHIQKRQMVVNTNLGEKPFVYAEANRKAKVTPAAGSSPGQRQNTSEVGTGTGPRLDARTGPGPSNADVLLRRVSDSLQDLNIVFDSEWDEAPPRRGGSNSTVSGASARSTARSRGEDEEDLGIDEEEEWGDFVPEEGDEDADDDDDDSEELDSDDDEPATGSAPVRNAGGTIPGTFRLLPPSPVSGASTSSIITMRGPRHRPTAAARKATINSGSLTSLGIEKEKKNELHTKPPQKFSEYNPIKSLEYFMAHSPTAAIKVFQGPRRYVCPCAAHCPTPLDFLLLDGREGSDRRTNDSGSVDSYEDEEDDDIHMMLVKAWETKVFPVIRRRFRNDSERRDGLEQIRGALQLGMLDIARQTVEFLYEEGGGLPRDLHLPTLEEIRAEAVRCTMDKLKPGVNVIIRPILQEDLSLLPPFAVSPMLRTFGLVGEVLEVDISNELVLVETYVESEGALVRFWYPVTSLDKSQSMKKPTLTTSTVNMFKLHSNLISLEGSLCHLYSRDCYLNISQHEKSPSYDLDAVQILSDNCLAHYPPTRDLFTYNLQCESPSLRFLQDCGNPSVLFYRRDHDMQLISSKIREKIREAAVANSFAELTKSMLDCLEKPEKFSKLEVALDRIQDVEVVSTGAAFSLVSFKALTKTLSNKQTASIDNTAHACLHLSSYDSGELSRHLMACYPLEPLSVVMHHASSGEDGQPQIISHTAPTNAGAANSSAAAALMKTMRKRNARFPPVMVPSDRIHCSISDLNLTDFICEVQAIPKEFPVAVLYIQELISEFHLGRASLSFQNVTEVVTRLLEFLDQYQLCPVMKDWIFSLIAELTRVKFPNSDEGWKPSPLDKVSKSCTPNRLFLELLLLHDKESSEQTLPAHMAPILAAISDSIENSSGTYSTAAGKGNIPFAQASLMFQISNFILSHQKSARPGPTWMSLKDPNFSFYFNSLNDLCLALNEVSEVMVNPYELIPSAAPAPPSSDPSPIATPQRRPSPTDSAQGVSSPAGTSQKKTQPKTFVAPKRKTVTSQKDLRHGKDPKKPNIAGPAPQTNAVAVVPVEPKVKPLLQTSSENQMVAFAKSSEIDWFNSQVVITRVLKDIVWHSPTDLQNAEAAQVLIGTVLDRLKVSVVHCHLLVIQAAPMNIDGMSIEASLIRALRGCGGFHGNEMWISGNSAVVEIRSIAKVNEAYDTLKHNKVWYPLEDYVLYPNVTVYRVSENLEVFCPSSPSPSSSSPATSPQASFPEGGQILQKFLMNKLSDPEIPDQLSFKAGEILTNIFMSCYGVTIPFVMEPEESELDGETQAKKVIMLSEEQILLKFPGNLLEVFVTNLKGQDEAEKMLNEVMQRFGEKMRANEFPALDVPVEGETTEKCKKDGKGGKEECSLAKNEQGSADISQNLKPTSNETSSSVGLSLHGYLEWCTDLLKNDVNSLWKALFATGYDIRLDRIWVSQDPSVIYDYFHSEKWSLEKDTALTSYMDQFGQCLHIDPTRIHASELTLTESDFLNPAYTVLQGVDLAYLRVRWGMFQKVNNLVAKRLISRVSLHNVKSSKRSIANLLHDSRQILLYFIKDTYLYKIIQVSASRGSDTPTPEVTLDPVSSIGSQDETAFKNQLSQVIQQMATITTSFYCVPPAQGGDPALPISVRFQGEEVLGLSGAFRYFLLDAVKELQGETVKLLCKCSSADAGKNKDSFIITPGKVSFGEEDFLYFLGQLIGISLRSDAPLALSLLRTTWRSLLLAEKEWNDKSDDLIEADALCATYLKKLESFGTRVAFENFLSLNAWPKFQYPSMNSTSTVPLCKDGASISVSFFNRDQFIKLIKQFREKELRSQNRVTKILTGLATIIPLPAVLGLFTSEHLELRIAGSPEVNLSLLKSHTHYQVGVSENDPHVMYFWATLESFTADELKKFVKFSTNLERLPVTCPCQLTQQDNHSHQDSPAINSNAVHAPPFPMKIAPIDLPPGATAEEIDKRLIRVETCLFLIRLPPYSSLQVTRQQLLFAINCREDPLSG